MENRCVVKITVGSIAEYFNMEEVVYFRSGMTADFLTRWLWYFEYLASLVKVANPHRRVVFYKGPHDVKLGKEWHEFRRAQLLKSRTIKLNKLENAIIDDDLFHFESQDHEKRKQNVRNEIEQLNRDEYQIDEFPEYINKIKLWI